ncbi:MAG: type I-MYXAN CRISPR-associated protein Cas6/Cmx6, partial [Pseudomonadota bacterium]
MFWQETDDKDPEIQGSQHVFDVIFQIHGERLKIDHAEALAESLAQILPAACFASTGIHRIRMASSGNGWNSPQDNNDEMLLSKRSRLILRSHRENQEAVLGLCQNKLVLHDREIRIGSGKIRHLIPIDT